MMRTMSLSNTEKQTVTNCVIQISVHRVVCIVRYEVKPWSSSTGPLGPPSVPPSVVLSNPPLGVHCEADVDPAFEFRIGTVQHVHTEEAFYLHYHCKRK